MTEKILYFMPGRGDLLSGRIGLLLYEKGFTLYGREAVPPFSQLTFAHQLDLIRNDILEKFWTTDSILIGHSYGAYLLLHTLAELEPYPGRILLLSPVLGAAISPDQTYMSRPPRAEKLLLLCRTGQFPIPAYLQIHTGADDVWCDPELARKISEHIPTCRLSIVAETGHRFEETQLRPILTAFLE